VFKCLGNFSPFGALIILYLKLDVSRPPSLDSIGDENPDNHILSWTDTTDPGSYQQAMMIVAILNN